MNPNKYFYVVTAIELRHWTSIDGNFSGRFELYEPHFEYTRQSARKEKKKYEGSEILKFENKAPYKFLGVVS